MKRLLLFLGVGVVAATLVPGAATANDRFEFNFGVGPGADNGPWQSGATDAELTPGALQVHDMEGAADEDWMIVSQRPFSSYEVRVDSMSDSLTYTTGAGDLLAVELVESDGTLVASGYVLSAPGTARVVTFRNDTATINDQQNIRISSPFCSTTATPCGPLDSVYDIRLFDTTYTIPRFNNSATQITVLVLQNSAENSVDTTAHFFNSAGTLLASQSQSIAAHGTFVLNTSTIGALAGQSGSIIVTNTGRYGILNGKAVAVEPATGFTFDTTMLPRPNN